MNQNQFSGLKACILLACFYLCTNVSFAQKIYVDSSVATSGNGSSWASAYKELRDALAAAQSDNYITAIYVAKGTYKPTNDNNRDSAFTILRGNLRLYGGYSSGGGSRDVNANPTLLNGDIGISGNDSDNSFHIMVVAAGVTNTIGSKTSDSLLIDGFFFTSQNRSDSSELDDFKLYNGDSVYRDIGMGLIIANVGANSVVSNCFFNNNIITTTTWR